MIHTFLHTSLNDIYEQYIKRNIDKIEGFIDFTDPFFKNGFFDRNYIEESELGRGAFGTVFKVTGRNDGKISAVKKFVSRIHKKDDTLRKFSNYSVVQTLDSKYDVKYFRA